MQEDSLISCHGELPSGCPELRETDKKKSIFRFFFFYMRTKLNFLCAMPVTV